MVVSLSDAIASLALAVSLITLGYTVYADLKKKRRDKIPKIEIFKIDFPKSLPNLETEWYKRHSRHYFGNQKRDITCGGIIKAVEMEPIEVREFDKKFGKIYFTDFNQTPCVMMNFLKETDNIIVDHQSTVIIFRNNGDILKGISLKSMDIEYYSNEGTVHLEGNPNEYKTFNIVRDGTFKIILDEATNDFQNSVCELNTDVYKNAQDGMNILEHKFDIYFLKYKSLKLNCIVMNLDNEKFELKITLALNGHYLVPKTEVVSIIK